MVILGVFVDRRGALAHIKQIRDIALLYIYSQSITFFYGLLALTFENEYFDILPYIYKQIWAIFRILLYIYP